MEMTTIKTIAVFTVIFGCFAVLYPKIFHPMLSQMFGFGGRNNQDDLVNSRIPPHLRKPGEGKTVRTGGGPDDDISRYMARAGPHPGMRAAAEMKKQAVGQGGGSGGGMMSVVLPMYAVGIVIYLIYTMIKVFGGKATNEKGDFLKSHFSDIQYDAKQKKFQSAAHNAEDDEDDEVSISKRFKKGRRDLERLLLKADKNNINAYEMHELRSRLLETEAQMARILGALETVEDQVGTVTGAGPSITEEGDEDWVDEPQQEAADGQTQEQKESPISPMDSSPDMDCYEIIDGKMVATTPESKSSPEIEELGPEYDMSDKRLISDAGDNDDSLIDGKETTELPQQHAKCKDDEDVNEEMIGSSAPEEDEKHPDLRKRLLQSKGEE